MTGKTTTPFPDDAPRPRNGRTLRDEALERVERAAPDDWKARAWTRLLQLAATGRDFTSEDVTATAGKAPEPRALGAVFSTASRHGLIRKSGFAVATSPTRHVAPIQVWRGVQR